EHVPGRFAHRRGVHAVWSVAGAGGGAPVPLAKGGIRARVRALNTDGTRRWHGGRVDTARISGVRFGGRGHDRSGTSASSGRAVASAGFGPGGSAGTQRVDSLGRDRW